MASNTEYKSWLSSEDETIVALEKAQSGRTTLDDIADALDEYKRLFIAGLASPAEKITLSRAYPENIEYAEACEMLKDDEDEMALMVVGGPASVEVVDREGHLITTDALKKAFKKYMDNFRGRNVMVMHSDVQVGHALPAYISKAGNIFKSGVDDKGLFFIAELRDDTKISNRVREQIEKGGMKSYSIAGSATKSKDIKKSDGSSILQVDDMELAEVTICEKGVNQNAHFELLKGDKAEGSCVDGSCLTKSHDPAPEPEIIAISKSEIPSFKQMFTSWIAKEQDSDKSRAIAIATAQAKKEGYKKFTDGSPGDDRRDKIAEAIKDSAKSAKEKAITKTFLVKQPQDYGGFQPGGKTKERKGTPLDPKKDKITVNVPYETGTKKYGTQLVTDPVTDSARRDMVASMENLGPTDSGSRNLMRERSNVGPLLTAMGYGRGISNPPETREERSALLRAGAERMGSGLDESAYDKEMLRRRGPSSTAGIGTFMNPQEVYQSQNPPSQEARDLRERRRKEPIIETQIASQTQNSITKTFLTKQPQDDNKTFRRIKAVGEGEAPIESDYTPSFGTLQTTRPNQLTSGGPGYKYDASTTYDAVLAGGDVPHGGETTSSGERKTPYNPAIYYGGSEDPRYKPDNKKLGTKTGDIGEGGTRYAAEKSITKQLFLNKLKELV